MKLTEKDITGAVARKMREDAGLTQTAFWKPLGVKQSVGCKYEQDVQIPHAVRILIVAHYVSGIKIDAGTQEGVAELARLGAIQSKHNQAKTVSRSVSAELAKAVKNLESARDALQSI